MGIDTCYPTKQLQILHATANHANWKCKLMTQSHANFLTKKYVSDLYTQCNEQKLLVPLFITT